MSGEGNLKRKKISHAVSAIAIETDQSKPVNHTAADQSKLVNYTDSRIEEEEEDPRVDINFDEPIDPVVH